MNVLDLVNEFIDLLRVPGVEEKKFYEVIPGRGNDGPTEVLNVHGVRLFAALADISIKEGSTKVVAEPEVDDSGKHTSKSHITVCSYANINVDSGGTRGYYGEIVQDTHWPGKEPRANPNYRETAFTRAERNALAGLIPGRYIVHRIKILSEEKVAKLKDEEKIAKVRDSARSKAAILETEGIASIDIIEKVKAMKGDMEDWTAVEWKILENEFDKTIAVNLTSVSETQAIEGQSDAEPAPEAEVMPEDDAATEDEF